MKKDQPTANPKKLKDTSNLFTSLTDITIEKISGGDKDHKGWCDLASFSQAGFHSRN